MKKPLIFFCLGLFILSANAQTWKEIKLDSIVSIKLPYTYTLKDTLGQKMLISKFSNGDVQILITPDNPMKMPDIEKKKHLLNYYDSYLKKIRSSSASGNITNEKDGQLGNLYYKDFTLEVDSGRGVQHRDFRILHENGATYVFQLLYQGIHKEYIEEDRKTFFNSIRVANSPPVQSQFTAGDGSSSDFDTPTLLFIAAIILVLAIVIFLIVRNRKRKRDTD